MGATRLLEYWEARESAIEREQEDPYRFGTELPHWKEADKHLAEVSKLCSDTCFAWGSFKQANGRKQKVQQLFPDALCIGQKNGNPFHPLWAGVYAKDKSGFGAPVKFTLPKIN